MAGKAKDRPRRYREFVESGLAETDVEFKAALKESPRSIGSDGFRARIDELYQTLIGTSNAPEDISFRLSKMLKKAEEKLDELRQPEN